MSVTESLARWAADLDLQDVPARTRDAATAHLLDGLGTAVAAARLRMAEPATRVALSLGGPPEATVIGTTQKISAPAAALAAGALVHALDFDDTHAAGLVHPTAVTLPAALAVGESTGATGAEVLRAAVIGFEVVCRVSMAAPHGFHSRGIHATHACGTIAAAAVASALMGLTAAQTVDALGIAGSASGGLLEFLDTPASTKALHPGTASLNGILAARLAVEGATGPASVLEGRFGLWAALSDKPADGAVALRGLGSAWETERIGFKPYPACQLSHASIDALRSVLDQLDGAATVRSVTADVHPDCVPIVCEPRADKVRPTSAYAAKFSLPWTLAALLTDGDLTVDTYAAASIARPEVSALADRIDVRVVDPGVVAADAPGRVLVRTDSGTVEGRVTRSTGGPDTPLSAPELAQKLRSCCGGSPLADELAESMRGLEKLPNLHHVLDLTARAAKEEAR